jgi:monoamine oxidase
LVLEVNDRIGGKTRSVSNDENGFIELGAAWINDTKQSEMWAMAQKYGLDAVIQTGWGLECIQNKDKSVAHVPYGDTPVSGSTFLQMLFG